MRVREADAPRPTRALSSHTSAFGVRWLWLGRLWERVEGGGGAGRGGTGVRRGWEVGIGNWCNAWSR